MSDKTTRKAVAVAIGATFVTSLAAANMASAAENPFSAKPLTSGYQIADAEKGKDGQCGAKKTKEGQCGGKEKVKEGNCGTKQMPKGKEGQCGEAKCGANKGKK